MMNIKGLVVMISTGPAYFVFILGENATHIYTAVTEYIHTTTTKKESVHNRIV